MLVTAADGNAHLLRKFLILRMEMYVVLHDENRVCIGWLSTLNKQ